MASIGKVLDRLVPREYDTPTTESPRMVTKGTQNVAALVDGRLHSLQDQLPDFHSLVPVQANSSTGCAILIQTATAILRWAAFKSFGRPLVVRHAQAVESTTCFAGSYCEVEGLDLRTPALKEKFEEMVSAAQQLMAQDVPIVEGSLSQAFLSKKLAAQGDSMSVEFLRTAAGETFRCHHFLDFYSLYVVTLTPSTSMCGMWKNVEFVQVEKGVVVRLDSLPPFCSNKGLMAAYEVAHNWGLLRKQSCVGEVNTRILNGGPHQFIQQEEAKFDNEVMKCALAVRAKSANIKLILIAGPSASGKTTFAAKLSLALRVVGFLPTVLSTDDYYRDIREPGYPLLPNGKPNHEHVEAVRLERLNEDMLKLFAGEAVDTPIFDMVNSRPSDKTRRLSMPSNGVLVMEGIFALDPRLTERISEDSKFKVFIVPLPHLNVTESFMLSNQTVRTLRRISRDFLHRGRGAAASIARLGAVLEGEQKNIFPCLKYADYVFNSFMDHELSVLRVHCTSLLQNVLPEDPTFPEANQFLQVLEYFYPATDRRLPDTSLLREFVGGSYFEAERPKLQEVSRMGSPVGTWTVLMDENGQPKARTAEEGLKLVEAPSVWRRSSFAGMKFARQQDTDKPIAAFVNCEAVPLSLPLKPMLEEAYISPIHATSAQGLAVYRATLTFMLFAATKKLFPKKTVVVPHGFGAEGSRLSVCYFAHFLEDGPQTIAADVVSQIKAQMQKYVQEKQVIKYQTVLSQKAIEFFESTGQVLSASLLRSRNLPEVPMAVCDGSKIIAMQPLAPDCGHVPIFELSPFEGGMVLCFPTLEHMTVAAPPPHPLSSSLEQHRIRVMKSQNVRCVGDINQKIFEGKAGDMVQVAHSVENIVLVELAQRVRKEGVRIVFVGGPSSSGKSIFAESLCAFLESSGVPTCRLVLEQYYKDINDEDFPVNDNDEKDPENIEALELDGLRGQVADLLRGCQIQAPVYDSDKKRPSDKTTPMFLAPGGVLVVEGRFALHEVLPDVPRGQMLRVLVTPLPLINLDELRFVSNQVLRTLRKIAQEYHAKGRTATDTLHAWGAAGEGEERHTLPFLSSVDMIVNSSSPFEIGAIKSVVFSLLEQVPADFSQEYAQALQLRKLLSWYHEVPGYSIPSSSMMTEFIGGSPFD